MRKLLWLFLMIAGIAHAGTITIPSGSTQSQIQTYFNSATSTNNVIAFSPGTYAVGSGSLTLPCISGGVTITGPVTSPSYTSWGAKTYHSQTAILSSSSGTSMIFSTQGGCTNAITVEYLQFANAGGININMPSSNLTVLYNSFLNIPCHNSAGCYYGEDQAIYAGGESSTSTVSNLDVEWNQLGDPNSCLSPVNIMTSTTDEGGVCAGMFIQATVNNITIKNNSFYHTEEGIHFPCFGDTCNGSSGVSPPIPTTSNVTFENNDLQQIHRINYEEQPQGASNIVVENNSVWNPYAPQTFSMGFSFACCGGNAPYSLLPGDVQCYPGGPSCASSTPATPNVPIIENNVMVQENTPNGYGWAYSVEWWGWGTQFLYNFTQGLSVNGGTTAGAGSPPWAANYNSSCGPNMGGAVGNEFPGGHFPTPAQTGNVFSSSCSATATTAPGISPSSGAQSFPLTVTLTDAGNTNSTTPIPQGNVTIWYTTDGSTPAPNSGTSQTCTTVGSTSCQFTMAAAGTVKAIGMWGQGANTISYPANYGFVPSSVVSNTYTGGGTPVTATPVFIPASSTFSGSQSVSVSDSTAGSSIFCTTDGSTPTPSSPPYTGPFTFTVTTTLQCIATASGYTNSNIASGTYTKTAPPTFLGGYQGNTGSVNTLTVGAGSVQQTAYGNYSAPPTPQAFSTVTNMDPYGNTAVWSSANPAILSVSSTGVVSCIAPTTGTPVNSQVAPIGGNGFSPWGWTCLAAPSPSPVQINGGVFSGITIASGNKSGGADIELGTAAADIECTDCTVSGGIQ